MKRSDDFETFSAKYDKATEHVDLQEHYYGVLPANFQVIKHARVSSHVDFILLTRSIFQVVMDEFKADMAFKCHICRKVFMNNVEFMKHLSLHMGMEIQTAMDITDLSQCRYCLKEFENAMLLQEHHEQVHTKSIEKYVCRICQTGFEDEKKFAHHMTQKHIRAELPYACYICNYRSSFQMDVIDHFLVRKNKTPFRKLTCFQIYYRRPHVDF